MTKTRREFLTESATIAAACCCGFGIATMLEGCGGTQYVTSVKDGANLIVNMADFGSKNFAMINHGDLPAPVYVQKLDTGGYKALLMSCTHKGCKVKPKGETFECGCHGSQFSMDGQVVKGPATTALTEFPVTSDGEKVFVQIN